MVHSNRFHILENGWKEAGLFFNENTAIRINFLYSLAGEVSLNKLRMLTDISGSVSVGVLTVSGKDIIAQIIFMSCMKCIFLNFLGYNRYVTMYLECTCVGKIVERSTYSNTLL